MFTGIISKTAKVEHAASRDGLYRVRIAQPQGWKVSLGESIAIDGICSTLANKSHNAFTVEYIPETLKKTAAGDLKKGSLVNLERSLTLRTLIDGHLLQGHIDARARISNVSQKKDGYLLTVLVPRHLLRFIAPLGSIAINGVSLTVAKRIGQQVTVALIPHTLAHTNLRLLKKGSTVNIEVDLLARYLVNASHA